MSGTANIQSSIFKIDHDTNTSSAPVLPGKTYTIITTGGGLAMTAPDVGIADFPFLYFNLSTDGFNGYLTTSRSPNAFAELATTPNQKAVANALDTASATNPVWQQVVGASEAQARAAFISLSNASIHANAVGVLSEQSHYLRDAVTDRLRQDFAYGTSFAPAGNVLSYAPEKPRNAYAAAIPFYKAPPLAAAPMPAQVYAVWAQGLGSRGSLKGDGNAAKTDHSLGGVISGLDVTFNGSWRLGVAGGYSQTSFNSPISPRPARATAIISHSMAAGGREHGACAAAPASPGATSSPRGRSPRLTWQACNAGIMTQRQPRCSARSATNSYSQPARWSRSLISLTCMSTAASMNLARRRCRDRRGSRPPTRRWACVALSN